jgi:hypothetical protein
MARRKYRPYRLGDLFGAHRSRASRPREYGRADLILAHCYLENAVEGLLRRAFIRDRAVNEMFEPGRPLWSFTTKVAVAYSMGLLLPDQRADLLIVNKVRNRVAHNIRNSTFRDKDMREWAWKLTATAELLAGARERRDTEWGRKMLRRLRDRQVAFAVGVTFLGHALESGWDIKRIVRPEPRDRSKVRKTPRKWPRSRG